MATLEARVARLEEQMHGQSQGIAELKESVTRLDEKVSRHFVWLVGMLVTVLAAVIGGLLSR